MDISNRMVSEAKRASQRAWYEAHKEKIKEKARDYRQKVYYENLELERTVSLERYYRKKLEAMNLPDQSGQG